MQAESAEEKGAVENGNDHEKDKRPAKKPKVSQDPQVHIPCVISKPKETLMQFALCAQKVVRPRMNIEKELLGQPDLIPSDSEMLLSIARLITKINLRSNETRDDNFLSCVYWYTLNSIRNLFSNLHWCSCVLVITHGRALKKCGHFPRQLYDY